eukprot:TRINITY_DN98023_c0_g1_i1.p1 TRINITY_DN98023_c0_g1~~TRINITY_DN98023_c0_g1_i1.p1  ORF type:complete len:111 (-),score=4.27 TRINITY_DN98023_c0_g1_i1:200-532(-)
MGSQAEECWTLLYNVLKCTSPVNIRFVSMLRVGNKSPELSFLFPKISFVAYFTSNHSDCFSTSTICTGGNLSTVLLHQKQSLHHTRYRSQHLQSVDTLSFTALAKCGSHT